MKKIVSNLNERVLVSIGNVSYDSWGCTYLGDTELYLKLPFVSLKRKSKDKCFTYDINMNTGNLVLSPILVSYDDDNVYFEKEKLGEYSYDCQLNVLVFDGIDTFITKEDLVLNKDIFEKYILDILKRQSYFNDLMINKLISFNYDSLRQIFNIFLTGQSIYLESLIDNKAYTTLKILLNSPNIISINTNNCQQVLAILNTLEKVGLKSDIEVDIFTMAFKNNINKFDNIFETIGNVINAFGVSNTQMINKLILVINEIATINKRNYYGYSDFTENNFFKTFKILDILYSLSNDNNDITGISNYLVKSIFKTYQCGLQFNDIIEYLSLYKDYMMIKNVYDDENNFELI